MSVKRYKVWLEEAGGFVEVVRGTDYDAATARLDHLPPLPQHHFLPQRGTSMTTYTKLGADLAPVDTDHQIVRIDHPLLAAPLLVAAHFAPKAMNWKAAKKWAESLDVGGFAWRLPTVEEAFFIADRSKYPAYDPSVFVGAGSDYPWIWTSTLDADDPSGYAWLVNLNDGNSSRSYQGKYNHVLAVRAGQ